MSVASSKDSKPSTPNINTPAGRIAAAQAGVEANRQAGLSFDKAGQSPNAGTGYGAGRISFDKSGNTLQDGKIVQFAGKQNRENFLSSQGLGNNGTIIDQAKFAKANFSGLATYNISGNKLEEPYRGTDYQLMQAYFESQHPGVKSDQPKQIPQSGLVSFGKSGNAGQARFGLNEIYRGSAKEDLVKQKEAERAAKIYPSTSNVDYFSGGKSNNSILWVAPLGNQYKNMGQGINNSLVRNSPQEAKAKENEAQRALGVYNAKKDEKADYTTGGTPENFGGVITGKSLGKNYGSAWVNAQLGTTQNFRGNTKEQQTSLTQQGKIKSSPGSSITDANSQISFANGLIGLSNQQISEKNNQIALGNGLISLSNKQIAQKNLQSESETKSYFNQGQKEDATFVFCPCF